MAQAPRDPNFVPAVLLESSTNAGTVITAKGDQTTGRLLVDVSGAGTVTSIASADGSIAVTDPTTTVDLAVVKSPKLTTGRTIAITGDLTYTSPSFDGSGNVTAAGTLASIIVAGGPIGSATVAPIITYDAKGRLTVVSSATITPAVSSITGLGTGIATFLATPSSANLASAVTDETGSGALVFAISPTLTTAVLGSSTATTQTPADNSTKVATTAYVDNAILGQRQKEAVKYASVAVLPSIIYANGSSGVGATLTGVALAAISLDGASPGVGDRVLIKNQASDFQNGIYVVTQTGSGIAVFILTRATDFDQATDIQTGDTIFVTAGNTLANTTWTYNGIDSPTMGTTSLTFVQAAGPGSYTSGNGISITGTSIAIDTSVTVDKTTAQALTNKTITSSTNVLGGVTMTLGSDANGDTYYRSGGVLTRLAKGTQNSLLRQGATNPGWSTETWATPGTSGNVLTSDGANWLSSAPAAGGVSFNTFIALIYNSVRNQVINVNSGTSTFDSGGDVKLTTSTGTTSSTMISYDVVNQGSNFKGYLGSPIWNGFVFLSGLNDATNFRFICGLGWFPSAITLTNRHIGNKIVGTSMYATQADGTTENASAALLTGLATNDVIEFKNTVNTTVSADYQYSKNNAAWSAKTNLTTNLPSGTNDFRLGTAGLDNNGAGTTANNAYWNGGYYMR